MPCWPWTASSEAAAGRTQSCNQAELLGLVWHAALLAAPKVCRGGNGLRKGTPPCHHSALLNSSKEFAAVSCRHLPGQIVETAQAVDDLMSSDFLERTRFPAAAALSSGLLDRLRLQVGLCRHKAQAQAALFCRYESRQRFVL